MNAADHTTPQEPLRGRRWWSRVWWFYVDGFRSMTVGRTLWLIIAIKVVVFFLILRWIFFPDFLAGKADTDEGKADYVRHELVKPSAPPNEQDSPAAPENPSDETNNQITDKPL